MEINLIPYKPQTEIQIVEMKNKPAMAAAMESVKIKEYPEELRNQNTAMLVDWLLNLIGVNSKEGGIEQHAVAFKHINETLGVYTYEEIKLAFEKYVNEELTGSDGKVLQAYSELNARVIGRVMSAYTELKRNDMNAYYAKKRQQEIDNPPKPPLEERLIIAINSMQYLWEGFLETGKIPIGYLHHYETLYKMGSLPKHTVEFRSEVMSRAKQSLVEATKTQPNRTTGVEKAIKNLENQKDTLAECKKVILCDFLNVLKDSDSSLPEYIETSLERLKNALE
jgi:hypothetical protein